MENLTEEQKKEIFLEMLRKEDRMQVLTYMLILAGELAAEANAGELSLSTGIKYNDTEYKVKMDIKVNEVKP